MIILHENKIIKFQIIKKQITLHWDYKNQHLDFQI